VEQSKKLEDILDKHIQSCIEKEGKFACIYFPSGGEETIDLSRLKKEDLQMWWFNPRDGHCYSNDNMISEEAIGLTTEKGEVVKIVTPTCGKEFDWVCVIESKNNHVTKPGKPQVYGEPPEVKKTFPAW
jgi:hypothetical protein